MEISRDRLDLKDDPAVISPPIIGPLYQCSKVVQVFGFVPQASLDVEVIGGNSVSGFPAGLPEPNGAIVPFQDALKADQQVRIRQHFGGATSDWSAPQTVRDHTKDYPAGLPRPVINPAAVFECGSRTGVGNLLPGSTVWITADGGEVGRVEGARPQQGVDIVPDYGPSNQVLAWSELCHDPSPPSPLEISQPHAAPLPAPDFEQPQEGSLQVVLNGLANGARFSLKKGGIDQGTFHTWGGRTIVGLLSPVGPGEPFEARQWLCSTDPPSNPGRTTGRPCSGLPAPTVAPIQDGDAHIRLLTFVPDARIKVFINGDKVGDGGGPAVTLTRPVHHGDIVDVFQVVGSCEGRTVQEIRSACVAPPVDDDPSALNLFPVGFKTYDGGTVSIRSNTHVIAGTIYYPAESDGTNTPFHARRAALGPVPIVFLVHGRHRTAPPTLSYLGYDYFQRQLAQMGIVAVSVNCVQTDNWGGWTDNIHDRAELVIRSIAYLQALSAGGDPVLVGHIDFNKIGLMGHSRGGETVVLIPEMITLPGVTIQAVLALAPVNSGAASGSPHGYPAFMTILPAFDGDVVNNNGAQFYDRAVNPGFRSQLYVEHANHNFFNRKWPDDTGGGLAVLSRDAHERILSAYGCALFRHVLLGHDTIGFLTGKVTPAGVDATKVQLAFGWGTGITTIDNFDDGNGIGLNSLGHPNTQNTGLVADEFAFSQSGAPQFNNSFFGETVGMVAQTGEVDGVFRIELANHMDLACREIWLRAADVYNTQNVITPETGFDLGLENVGGDVTWVDSDEVGGLPLPQDRRVFDLANGYPDKTKTMLRTFRFPVHCFGMTDAESIVAILLRLNRSKPRPIAFDDIQIV